MLVKLIAGNSPKKLKGCPSPTSVVTIPASSSRGHHRRGLSNDDSSSTKTEIEEMDQFSDLVIINDYCE
jgi:hypothetical protein